MHVHDSRYRAFGKHRVIQYFRFHYFLAVSPELCVQHHTGVFFQFPGEIFLHGVLCVIRGMRCEKAQGSKVDAQQFRAAQAHPPCGGKQCAIPSKHQPELRGISQIFINPEARGIKSGIGPGTGK